MKSDELINDNALRTLKARYLRRDSSGKIIETPREMFARVALHIASAHRAYEDESSVARYADEFEHVMSAGILLPNSPTLMNAGLPNGMLSACFVLPVGDSIDEIFESVKDAAMIQKAGGGTGFSFDRLRPTGDYISSSGGKTSGPISFWRVFSEATRAIQQGANRRGANMGMMSVEHPDILKFITSKARAGEFENFNISIKIPRRFMESLRSNPDGPHVVINPRTGAGFHLPRSLDVPSYELADLAPAGNAPKSPVLTVQDVWRMIVNDAWATGEPGLCFIDRVNEDNPTPHLGAIEATNPCGEQPLLDWEACNLASIDVAKFVQGGGLDEQALARTIRLGVVMLDDVIDVNNYVVAEIDRVCRGNRKIGLGYMGVADAMMELGVKYDSDEGLAFADRLGALLKENALAAGEELAKVRGSFPNWSGSTWDTHHGRAMRNAALTTIAPTGTLSILAGCSGGIEPPFALAFYRHILGGQEMLEVNAPFAKYARANGIWNDELIDKLSAGRSLREIPGISDDAKRLFVTAFDVSFEWHVRMQAAFQKHVDGAISKTINLPQWASPADVESAFNLAYDLGCKGVTVYRDQCRMGQPMALEQARALCPQCRRPVAAPAGCARCPYCGCPLCG
ncbi:MAG: adenosylcobalamin-dependent ribonucleoside-diphosphate reductase [Planctomycetes bacterium]|nr:adenosylcobalamin-dependent ribonucleoside-diphosphate reductase [Planctomycetota bacterium]